MEIEKLTIKVEGEHAGELIEGTLVQLIHWGIEIGAIHYTGTWHEPATDEDISYGRYGGTNHRHYCELERYLHKILTEYQDKFFQFSKYDGELLATGIQPIVETLGSYDHECFDEEDGLEDKVVDLTVHSKFAKYK